jgi:arylsulfatase A-like enzyme
MIGQNVGLIDMYPTLSELCGLPAVAGQEGRSLVPLMKNPAKSWEYPVLSTYLKNHHAIRTSTWCYIRYENGEEELYDRIVDPDEIHNLAGNPAFAQIKQELGGYMPAPIA